ncbi:MAG: hypothetical protein NTX73_16695 [Rhodobacterales bacterium]|nr:hypothetical protein [Rhodobacterales bacterium]
MLNFIKNFRADEDGAVTVDWVVLTAAIVGLGIAVLTTVSGGAEDLAGLGIAVLTTVSGGAEDLAGDIGDELTAIDPGAGV